MREIVRYPSLRIFRYLSHLSHLSYLSHLVSFLPLIPLFVTDRVAQLLRMSNLFAVRSAGDGFVPRDPRRY